MRKIFGLILAAIIIFIYVFIKQNPENIFVSKILSSGEKTICTMEYAPVCAKINIQCIKAPCKPIEQTYWNRCIMEQNKLATFLYNWECKKD